MSTRSDSSSQVVLFSFFSLLAATFILLARFSTKSSISLTESLSLYFLSFRHLFISSSESLSYCSSSKGVYARSFSWDSDTDLRYSSDNGILSLLVDSLIIFPFVLERLGILGFVWAWQHRLCLLRQFWPVLFGEHVSYAFL